MPSQANAGTIPIFDKTIGPQWMQHTVDVECSDCFLGFSWDFVFDLHMRLFKVENIEFGFKNMTAIGALPPDRAALTPIRSDGWKWHP